MINGLQESGVSNSLSEENAQTEFLRSSSVVHYIDATEEGVITACSPAVERALQQSAEQLAGRIVWDLMPNADAAALQDCLENAERSVWVQLSLCTAGRATIALRCVAHKKRDGFVLIGEPAAVKEDDLHQRRMAAELQRSNSDLEQFAYIASHDLQEPLRTVSGFAQLLQRKYRGRLDPQADEYIEFCISGTKRLNDLIAGLLTYSRVGRMGESRERVDLNEIVQEVMLLLGRAIQEANADVECSQLPAVWANRQQMFQVIENLIGNAVKFRGVRSPKIRVTAECEEGQRILSVSDNGGGIDQQYLERIFEPFQRLHGREYPGSGIGLALCRKVIERQGGRIWAESNPGVGTKIRFTLTA
jgi:light-regulated signal transduction histidine kinase (bacteriophytochrome)